MLDARKAAIIDFISHAVFADNKPARKGRAKQR
jgi:hypothetical protein